MTCEENSNLETEIDQDWRHNIGCAHTLMAVSSLESEACYQLQQASVVQL